MVEQIFDFWIGIIVPPVHFRRLWACNSLYTLWISRWIATARERTPGSIDNDVTGVSECSQQRGNLKDNGYSRLQYTYV
ncbi:MULTISPECIES: hypothetical protein [Photorhabdus]|nr:MULTISPECIES: hypothetical protein [Photorhabdus]NDL47444.1 hypothetical protein [Photorhabdus laumondii subsp. laumondii]